MLWQLVLTTVVMYGGHVGVATSVLYSHNRYEECKILAESMSSETKLGYATIVKRAACERVRHGE